MLTGHRRLDPDVLGGELPGWEILDDDLRVVATVKTKREAQQIVKRQCVEHRYDNDTDRCMCGGEVMYFDGVGQGQGNGCEVNNEPWS